MNNFSGGKKGRETGATAAAARRFRQRLQSEFKRIYMKSRLTVSVFARRLPMKVARARDLLAGRAQVSVGELRAAKLAFRDGAPFPREPLPSGAVKTFSARRDHKSPFDESEEIKQLSHLAKELHRRLANLHERAT